MKDSNVEVKKIYKNLLTACPGLKSASGLTGGTRRTAPTTTLASFGACCSESQNLRPSPWSYMQPNRIDSTAAPYCCPNARNFATWNEKVVRFFNPI